MKSILRKVREHSDDDQILPSAPNVQSLTLGQLGSAQDLLVGALWTMQVAKSLLEEGILFPMLKQYYR